MTSDLTSRLRRMLAGAGLMVLATAAVARPAAVQDLKRLPPQARAAAVQALVAKQQAARKAGAVAGLDSTAPTVTAFNVGRRLDPSKTWNQVLVDITIKDALSGLSWAYADFVGPSGQWITLYMPYGYGQTVEEIHAALHMSPAYEPGTWKAYDLYGYDVAGNYFYKDQNALRALGNIQFKVSSTVYDVTPPTLVSGTVSATSISLSTPWPGTESSGPFVTAKLAVTDAGNTGVSGPAYSYAQYCTQDLVNCFGLGNDYYYYATTPYGVTSATQTLGTQLYDGFPTGEYHLYYVQLGDNAGNWISYTSSEFGGETDFSTLFNSTVITLTP